MLPNLIFALVLLPKIFTVFFITSSEADVSILHPSANRRTTSEPRALYIVSVEKAAGGSLLVSSQWQVEQLIRVSTPAEKEDFPKTFLRLFERNTTMEFLYFSVQLYSGYSRADTIRFSYSDAMTVRSFWTQPAFSNLVSLAKRSDISLILLGVRGWKDSVYAASYDDPENDGRYLYKIPVELIPGQNDVCLMTGTDKKKAVVCRMEFKPDASTGSDLFHNSSLENTCTPCHEGLPSSDNGNTMTATCNTCHRSILSGKVVHTAADGGDCSSCHEWNAEKKAVSLGADVPTGCYTCHGDISTTVESATVPHAVVGDCTTCHTPHSSQNAKLLKAKTNQLCTGCHEMYKTDHPVRKHPVGLAKLQGRPNEELSCTSCHVPHGSPNKALLRWEGSGFSVCQNCHHK